MSMKKQLETWRIHISVSTESIYSKPKSIEGKREEDNFLIKAVQSFFKNKNIWRLTQHAEDDSRCLQCVGMNSIDKRYHINTVPVWLNWFYKILPWHAEKVSIADGRWPILILRAIQMWQNSTVSGFTNWNPFKMKEVVRDNLNNDLSENF